MSDTSARASELFLRACDMRNPEVRRAFLDRQCAGDEELRRAVDTLLATYDATRAGGSAQAPPPAPRVPVPALSWAAASESAPAEGSAGRDESVGGVLAGKYKLIQQIGEGGMGSVYMAQQTVPVNRLVAVKVIKAGMDSKEVLARFEAERQALALMDHPNIARVLDAGTTSSGSPFFVMELVKGVPITKFCDDRKLSPRARLELFVQVCHGIQHAHHKGIIHRDIKPSNVLVALYDDLPVPKVIDFGVAKAAGQPLTDRSLMTGFGSIVGTPEYMSPEQATLNQLDVDTRSDVYALGVLLYELLTGSTPLTRETMAEGALLEILRVVREVEAPKPSTRVSTSTALPAIAASRGLEPQKLSSLMRGELDWILLKALEKDRARRYESANAFASDVQRYLTGEQVHAVPPSVGYRFRKYLRRHKGMAAAVAGTAAALLVGLVAFAWQAKVATGQRDRALKAEAEAKARADELKLVAEFQGGMLEQIDPTASGRGLTEDVTARLAAALTKRAVPEAERTAQLAAFQEQWGRVNATDAARELIDRAILKPAIATIETKFRDQPLVDAQLRQVLAIRYRKLGLFPAAMPLQTRALETRRRLLGDDHTATMESAAEMAGLLLEWGKLTDADPVIRDSLERRRRVLGADHRDTLASLQLQSLLRLAQGNAKEGEQLAREVLAGFTRALGEADELTIASSSNLASALQRLDRAEEAERIFRDTLERARASLGAEHPTTMNLLNNLGTLLQGQQRLAEAETCFRELLALRRVVSGEEHPDTLVTMGNLGFVLEAQGRTGEAEPLLRESLEKRRRVLGADHPITLFGLNDLGNLLATQGKLAEAEPYLREAFERRRRVIGAANDVTVATGAAHAQVLSKLGRGPEAETLLRGQADALQRELGDEHEATLSAQHKLGALLLGLRKMPEAEAVLRTMLKAAPRVLGESHPSVLDATDGLCGALFAQGKLAEAEASLRAALATRRRLLGDAHASTLLVLGTLVTSLTTQDKHAEAEKVLREQVTVLRKVRGDEHAETLAALALLGVTVQHQDRDADAEPLLREALAAQRKVLGPDHAETLKSMHNVCVVLMNQEKVAEAEPFLREILESQRRVKGKEAPDTLFAMGNLAGSLQGLGRLPEAETLLREALAVAPRVLEVDHGFTISSVFALGAVLLAQGKAAEAEPVLREALQVARRLAGEDHPDTLDAMWKVGAALYRQRKYSEAEPVLRDAYERRRRVLGAEAPPTLASIATLGATLRGLGRHGDAVDLLAPIVEPMRKAFPGAQELAFGNFLSNLGRARAALSKVPADFALAEPELLEALAIMARRQGPYPSDARESMEALVSLYAAWDAAEPGKGHDAKAAPWKAKLEAGGK